MKRVAEPIETNDLCSYGCGNIARFKNGSGNLMCEDRSNKCPAVKNRNSSGTRSAYSSGKRLPADQRYKDLPQEVKDSMAWRRGKTAKDDPRIQSKYDPQTVFSYGGKGPHKRLLIEERGHACECCGLDVWLDEPITLELEHSNGDRQDNTRANLKLLCPNCHSKTSTWRGRSINKSKVIITDDEFIEALKAEPSIRQALIKLNLTPKAANYKRAYDLLYGAPLA